MLLIESGFNFNLHVLAYILDDKQNFDVQSAIQRLPLAEELPPSMSADEIADIDKLFDALVPDYAAPCVNAGEKISLTHFMYFVMFLCFFFSSVFTKSQYLY